MTTYEIVYLVVDIVGCVLLVVAGGLWIKIYTLKLNTQIERARQEFNKDTVRTCTFKREGRTWYGMPLYKCGNCSAGHRIDEIGLYCPNCGAAIVSVEGKYKTPKGGDE